MFDLCLNYERSPKHGWSQTNEQKSDPHKSTESDSLESKQNLTKEGQKKNFKKQNLNSVICNIKRALPLSQPTMKEKEKKSTSITYDDISFFFFFWFKSQSFGIDIHVSSLARFRL